MTFSDAQKVQDVLNAGQEVNRIRGENRAKINNQANGAPLSAYEAQKLKLKINVEWGELSRLLQQARRQCEEAILGPSNYFRVHLPKAPNDKRSLWEETITTSINRTMKRCYEYADLKEDQILNLIAHGIGPQIWEDKESWVPDTVALEDLRVATDTKISLTNLEWFGVRKAYTCGELARKVFGKYASKGWKTASVSKILEQHKNINYQTASYTYNWLDQPEKMYELLKQNLGFYLSDALPTIGLWHFYYLETDDPKEKYWKLCVVPDATSGGSSPVPTDQFLYKSDKHCAENLSELLHIQFGDLNNKSPRLYHSVRSLGFKLLEPCFWTNIARCRGLQHLMENMNVWLRVSDPTGRARAQAIELFDKAIVPEGVTVVPQNERHQIDSRFMEFMMAQLRQLMAEESAAYNQDVDTGTAKEQTATEALAKVQQASAEMSSILGRWFRKEIGSYREICRRFCLSGSRHKDAVAFQKTCKQVGIQSQYLVVEDWDIEPEIPMGAGHPTMQLTEAQLMMQVRPLHDPSAQQEILHMYDEAVLKNPAAAQRLAPLNTTRKPSSGVEWAAQIFPLLMEGLPPPEKEGVPIIDQIETLLGLTAGRILILKQSTATPDHINGLGNVIKYIVGLIKQFSGDQSQLERANQYSASVKELIKEIKQLAQAAQNNGNGQIDPEAIAKAKATQMQAEVKAHATAMTTAQKVKQKEVSHQQKSRQQEQSHRLKLDQSRQEFLDEQARKDLETAADVHRQNVIAENQPSEE